MTLLISFLIILAIISTKLSSKFGLPLLIGFILIGVVVGSDVLNLFYFDNADLTKRVADILLIFIIFDGGFRITKKAFTSVAGPSLTLATFGVALTAGILGLAIHFVFNFDLVYSLVISSIISSTDAAAVFMITKANPIKKNLATTLNIESAANDPMAIILTITFIQIATGSFSSPFLAIIKLLWQFAGGVLVGYVCFRVSHFMFDRLNSDSRGDYSVLLIGCILLTYGLSDLLGANGIISVFFMGYWLGNSQFPAKRYVTSFLESISTIFNMALFIMLGLLAFPHRFVNIWKDALIIVAVMMFVARPFAVLISTIPFKYSLKEKTFLMWGGIKGAVPIVLATYPMAAGIDSNGFIFDTIFFAVFLSCLIQGMTLAPLSKLFKFTEKRKVDSPHTVELHSLKSSEIDMFEVTVDEKSANIDKKISELNFDKDVLISSIVRDGQIIFPKGDTKLKENDILYILTHSSKIKEVKKSINVTKPAIASEG
ncbi:potassium/proton antiporter [Treponema pectinovorum]|uniref:potassium/proton antiporter n=1 Tax=Treponema pectinovorum TaxID=164 RepID=UPI003D900D95